MRIGVDGVIFASNLTGIGNYGYQLLRAMAVRAPQHEFVVLAQQPLAVTFAEPNISVWHDHGLPARNLYWWKLVGMARACRRAAVDVFWAAGGIAPFFMPCPVVLTVYDFVYRVDPQTMSWRTRWFRHLNQGWWIRHAARVFSISRASGDEMEHYYGRRVDGIVYPAVSEAYTRRGTEEVAAVRVRHGLGARYNVIVGTLEPRKNLPLFVSEYLAFAGAHPGCGLPPLALVGGKGWKDAEILRVLEAGERAGLVVRLGYVAEEELPALYSGAELFFMPSRYEGFGMPILEARKCGCPVVCSDVPAMREAGGGQALYHPPTAAGIRWALEEIYVQGRRPVSDSAAGVDWSWASGAARVLPLVEQAAHGR